MGCDIHPYVEVRSNGKWEKSDVNVPDDRNYWAFAKLANVRNGVGFAGSDTGNTIVPISEPRGLPDDTSICESTGIDLGDHSHSWVLLSELLAVNFNEPVTQRGLVKHDVAEAFRKHGILPRKWCSGVWGNGSDEYEQLEWNEPLYDAASLLPKIIAAISNLGAPEDVRLVFGFDS